MSNHVETITEATRSAVLSLANPADRERVVKALVAEFLPPPFYRSKPTMRAATAWIWALEPWDRVFAVDDVIRALLGPDTDKATRLPVYNVLGYLVKTKQLERVSLGQYRRRING